MKLKDAAVDLDRIENGAWVNNIPDLAGFRLKVRGSGNKQWRKMQQQLLQAVPRGKRANGGLDPEGAGPHHQHAVGELRGDRLGWA